MKKLIVGATMALGFAGSLGIASSASAEYTAGGEPQRPMQELGANRGTVDGSSFPPSDELIGQQPLPAQVRYFEERAAAIRAETADYRSVGGPPAGAGD